MFRSKTTKDHPQASQFQKEFFSLLQECGHLSTEKINVVHKKFHTYQQVIQKFICKFNLISHNDLSKIWTRHFFDSIIPIKLFTYEFRLIHNNPTTCLQNVTFASQKNKWWDKKSIDIGTGAGFPGLPIALVCPELSLTLVDSIKKKCIFLENILLPAIFSGEWPWQALNPLPLGIHPPVWVREKKASSPRRRGVGVRRISVICDRAEHLALQKEEREQYDFGFARALAEPAVAMELLLPFIKLGGKAFFWTSGESWSRQEKIEKTAELLGAEFYKKAEYFLPDDHRKREILVLQKTAETAPEFPRKVSALKKRLKQVI